MEIFIILLMTGFPGVKQSTGGINDLFDITFPKIKNNGWGQLVSMI